MNTQHTDPATGDGKAWRYEPRRFDKWIVDIVSPDGKYVASILDWPDATASAKRIIAALNSPSKQAAKDDLIDLMRDEFARIKSVVPDNAEVVGLCDRAATAIMQNVPVIQQRDDALKQIAKLKYENEILRSIPTENEWAILLDACQIAIEHCPCAIAERDSGHLVGCYVPQLQSAIALLTEAKGTK